MSNKNKIIIFIWIILSIVIGFIYTSSLEMKKQEIDKYDWINPLIKQTISYDVDNLNYDNIKKAKYELEEILKSSNDEEYLSKANFLLGLLDAYNKDYKYAIKKFNKSISYFDSIKNIQMKTKVYYELSRMYLYEGEYSKSEEAFENMKKIAIKTNNKKDIIEHSICRSYDIYYVPDGKNKSVKILEDALKLAKEIKYDEIEDVYFSLGRAYWSADMLIESINTKLEALSISQGKNNKFKIAKISTDIGIDYLYSGNYEAAKIYLSRVLAFNFDDKYEEARAKSNSLLNLFDVYVSTKEYEKAEECLITLEENISKQQEGTYKEDYYIYMYVNKASLEIEKGNPEEALKLLDLASEKYSKRDNFSFYDFDIKLVQKYGEAYYKLGNYQKALDYNKQEEKLAKESGLSYLEEDYNEKIYLAYKAIGNYDNAIKYLEKNLNLKRDEGREKDRQYSQYLVEEFENTKNLKKINELEDFKNIMKILLLVLTIFTIIISIFSYSIYKKNKEIRRLNKLFKNLSLTDHLTNVQNRRSLEEYLDIKWPLYKDSKMPISFAMIDIDFFKKYNDNYGHLKGDIVLEEIARSIRSSCRSTDFLARYGGEEFIAIMLNTNKNEAINLAERIRKNIYELNIKHDYSEISDRITISLGVATASDEYYKDYHEYIKKADEALYEAKQSGKNKWVFLD